MENKKNESLYWRLSLQNIKTTTTTTTTQCYLWAKADAGGKAIQHYFDFGQVT